ncbi:MAG: cytochrome c oxidase accessory protein CcoG [Betaproteobacteria bacterium RIFCSPLOWO2_02_FULL_62_17]|nr:MAG: cytochrome c oxidase accessory protein CcoG [Betaproteobacteria bacterium RIFCSPLOWO2_02_FULL_62_17]
MHLVPKEAIDALAVIEEPLYEVRKQIYPRAVSGWFAGWRVALVLATQLVFYGGAWLQWNGRQAVLFDLAARKFYIFGLVLWPQDFIYLTALLVISALSLFLFTTAAGRLWCGYACPQTVYTEIFLWIERKVEGDRTRRINLDAEPMSARKFRLKTTKHFLWIALSVWTGFTFVGYFTPIHELAEEVAAFSTGPWESFWIIFYGFATYGNAGWMREEVCKHMCPYARFQSAMFDQDTMIITYDRARGEPRGPRFKSADPAALGLGACVNCNLCVQVCPTGIDIRDGLQYECIGCTACIDACNRVMRNFGYAPGLIRYSTENALLHGWDFRRILRRLARPRMLAYAALLVVITAGALVSLSLRQPLKLDVIRDRGSFSREMEDGSIENVYRLQLMNTRESAETFVIRASGLPTLAVAANDTIMVAAATSLMVPLKLRLQPGQAPSGAHAIEIEVQDAGDARIAAREHSVFVIR